MPTVKKFLAGVITGDVNHDEANDANTSIFKKIMSGILFVVFLLIGLGNWSDSKQLILEVYQGVIANFTHKVEESTLSKLDIGNYLAFAERQVGMPQVIKTSDIDSDIEYRYYKDNKYLLTIISKKERVSGIVVHSLEHNKDYLSDFTPLIPFTNTQLKVDSIEKAIGHQNDFFFDNHNIAYFMKSKQLGASGMHLYLSVGYTGYQSQQAANKELLNQLDNALVVDDNEKFEPIINRLTQTTASFYSISELEPHFTADALLTKYEFNAYF
ncbi:hypothetical protein L2725_21345 [Shewanella corallii]|uniref:Uncharacterized protein n=1 Tax=Shewanella corallii TaxID=560080 RepID=A0ABT0NCS6_9GAMM|nr:ETEC_3214 domain-containing protein [Shewanella corallii]MCL2916284.1 hypothetical protein [Shewanella corallii]